MSETEAVEILKKLLDLLKAWWTPVMIISYFLGFCLVVFGLITLSRTKMNSQMNSQSIMVPILTILAGVLLLSLPSFLDVLSQTIFSMDVSNDPLSTYSIDNNDVESAYINFAFAFFTMVGLISIVRGIYLMYKASTSQQISFSSSIIFLAAGIIMINGERFLELFGISTGGVVQSAIDGLLDHVN